MRVPSRAPASLASAAQVLTPAASAARGHVCSGLLAAGALAAALLSTSASAQSSLTDQQVPSRAPGFKPSATARARVTYDSNVARGNDSAAALRGVSGADTIYGVDVIGDLLASVGPAQAFLRGGAGYEWYQKNSELNRERIDLAGGLSTGLGPCGGSVVVGYARRQSDLLDLTIGVTENTQQDRSIGVNIGCTPVAGLATSVGARHSETSNSASQGVIEPTTNSVDATIGYTNRSIGTLSLIGQYQKTEYEVPPDPLLQRASPGLELYNVGFRYLRPIGARLVGQLGLSYVSTKSDGGGQDQDGLASDIALSYRVTPRLRTNLAYRRNVTATIQLGSNYSINERLEFNSSYMLSRRTNVSVGAAHATREYKGELDPSLFGGVTDEEVGSAFGAASFLLGRYLTLGLEARYEDRTTDQPLFDYSSYRVGLTANTAF